MRENDYRLLDRTTPMRLYRDKIAVARKAGYRWFSEMVIREYVDKGKSMRQIAEMTCLGRNTIRDYLRNWKVPARSPGGNHHKKRPKISPQARPAALHPPAACRLSPVHRNRGDRPRRLSL